jgi:hypothetical protein
MGGYIGVYFWNDLLMAISRSRFGFYPSIDGVPIPPDKMGLPDSKLDLSSPESFNNHHNYWPKRLFGRHMLYRTLRSLSSHQYFVPVDVHEYLHVSYDPPKLPTPTQALLEITRAISAGDKLYDRSNGENTCRDIGEEIIKQVFESYSSLQRRQNNHNGRLLSSALNDIFKDLEPQDAMILSLYKQEFGNEQIH